MKVSRFMRPSRLWVATAAAWLTLSAAIVPGASAGEAPTTPAASPGPFADLTPLHWAAQPLAALKAAGVVRGDGSGRFFPDRPVTRAELAKMIVTAHGLAPSTAVIPVFADVSGTVWHRPFVEMAYRMAIIQGRGASFEPASTVSRQELAVIMVRAMAWEKAAQDLSWSAVQTALQFTDRRQIEGWAENYVALAVQRGLLQGTGDGRFRPDEPATRVQAAAVIARHLMVPREGLQETTVDGIRLRYLQALDTTATAYGAGEPWLSDTSALGLKVRDGLVAVDPSVIPLGSHIYVEGYGYGIAGDTGGAIKGNRIDLYISDSAEKVLAFGYQKRRVYILMRP